MPADSNVHAPVDFWMDMFLRDDDDNNNNNGDNNGVVNTENSNALENNQGSNGNAVDMDIDDEFDGGNNSNNVETSGGRRDTEEDKEDKTIDSLFKKHKPKWLEYPEVYINPPTMCSVNKFVQCVRDTFFTEQCEFSPFGPEILFLGSDTPSLPSHLMKWVWVMNCINSLNSYDNCVFEVRDITQLRHKRENQQSIITGIARRSELNGEYVLPAKLSHFRGFSGGCEVSYAQRVINSTKVQNESSKSTSFYRNIKPVEMVWEVLPMRYTMTEMGIQSKRIFHVLRTVLAPGFDLMGCFASMEQNRNMKWKNNISYDEILKILSDVLFCEANIGLGINGGFNRESHIPSPMDVHREINCMMNGYAIGSPYLLCEKISRRLYLDEISNVEINGFPDLSTEPAQISCLHVYDKYHAKYTNYLDCFNTWLETQRLNLKHTRSKKPDKPKDQDEECSEEENLKVRRNKPSGPYQTLLYMSGVDVKARRGKMKEQADSPADGAKDSAMGDGEDVADPDNRSGNASSLLDDGNDSDCSGSEYEVEGGRIKEGQVDEAGNKLFPAYFGIIGRPRRSERALEAHELLESEVLDLVVGEFWKDLKLQRNSATCLYMTFHLSSWCDGLPFEKCENLRCPQLTIATMTPFRYVDHVDANDLEFIKAHLGDQCKVVNETIMADKYGKDSSSWGDLPHACMFRSTRDALKTSLKTMTGDIMNPANVANLVQVYRNYIHSQAVVHTQAIAADQMMSDRVLFSSHCLDKVSLDINDRMMQGFKLRVVMDEMIQQKVCTMFHPDYSYFVDIMHVLTFNNKYIRANPINLSVLWAFMISDVLTHLGSHHETWTWMMYTVNVLGGCGHLRASTDDHACRIPVLFTSKPNSVGFNAIITRMMKHMVNFISELIPDISSEFLEAMRYMKLDRTTRAGVEGVSSVLFVNGVKEQVPSRRMFMRNMIMDEGYRSIDVSALNGLVCSIPRDSDGGSGNILKSVDPGNKGGAHLQGHQKQIPGLSPFLIGLTSNSNPHSAPIGESIKSLAVVAANFPPGAQPGGVLSSVRGKRSCRINDYVPCTTNSASSLPQEKDEREIFAWTTSVLWMTTRQLALINKTGQIDFELNTIQVKYMEWVRNLMSYMFYSMFGSVLFPSYDRVIAGYISRQISTTFLVTVARNICIHSNMADANAAALMDMESSPLTLQSLNVALGNAMMHLVDMNLVLVHQFFRDELHTPYIDLITLLRFFQGVPVDASAFPDLRDVVRDFFNPIIERRMRNPETFNKGYFQSGFLATNEDYMQKESYLESYCGITKGSYFTYTSAFRECLAKKFDFLTILNIDEKNANLRYLFEYAGLPYDEAMFTNQVGHMSPNELNSGNYVVVALGDNKQISKVYVNVMQHLIMCAIMGDRELHSDNVFHLGANIYQLLLERATPSQVTPFGSLIYEQYVQNKTDVIPMRVQYDMYRRPGYFLRAVNDRGMEETGEMTELPRQIANHPPEDTVHMGPWLRLYSILYSGKFPDRVAPFPTYNGRSPELVPGRIYPIFCYKDNNSEEARQKKAAEKLKHKKQLSVTTPDRQISVEYDTAATEEDADSDAPTDEYGRLDDFAMGTVCICPHGDPRVVITMCEDKERDVIGIDEWVEHMQIKGIVVGPLVYRGNALVKMGENAMGVIIKWPDDANEIDFNGVPFPNPDNLQSSAYYKQKEREMKQQQRPISLCVSDSSLSVPGGDNSNVQEGRGMKNCRANQRQCPADVFHEHVFDTGQYMSIDGDYCVRQVNICGKQRTYFDESVHFTQVHRDLVPIGTCVYVCLDNFQSWPCYKYGEFTHLKCFLRYPDEADANLCGDDNLDMENYIFVSFRVKGPNKFSTMHVRGFTFDRIYFPTDAGEDIGARVRSVTDHVMLNV